MFDLGVGERQNRSKRPLEEALDDEDAEPDVSNDQSAKDDEAEEEIDSDEERERRLEGLEGELDGLYDEYKERMSEKDTKWRVKQSRMKDRNYDAWHGIREDGEKDDGEEEDEAESEEGGWDLVRQRRDREEAETDVETSDDEETAPRGTAQPGLVQTSRRLVTSLRGPEQRAALSRQAQLWFDQPAFKSAGLEKLLELDDAAERETQSPSNSLETPDDDIEMAEQGNDFEVVPLENAWDVDNEDEDEVKRKVIQGECLDRWRSKSALTTQIRAF